MTTGAAGSTASATITGTAPNQTLNLTIPQGQQGPVGAGAPDATTTTKGSIQLAGDLGGTAAAPTVPGLAGKANTSHTHTAANISDSTATGRSVLTATDAAAARTAIGAGTSSLIIGTTASTAAAGNHTHADLTNATASAVANTLVKRDANGDANFGGARVLNFGGFRVNGTLTNTTYVTDAANVLQSPFDGIYHDNLAFNRHWGAPVITEALAATPTTFTAAASASDHNIFFNTKQAQALAVANTTWRKSIRYQWNSFNIAWNNATWLVLGHTYTDPAPNKTVVVETSADGTTWTVRHTSTYDTVGGPVWHYISNYSGDSYFRLTITHNSGADIGLSTIRVLTPRWGDQGGGTELTLPYGWDNDRGVTFVRAYSDAATPLSSTELVRKDYVDSQVSTRAASSHTHTAANISDSTAVGRSVIIAADAAAARTAIGAGTSNLTIGTTSTTAKAGDYAPPAATTSATGLVQLTNHLGGTATAPTVRSASETQAGIVELATSAETTTGTDTTRAVHPAALKTELAKQVTAGGGILEMRSMTQAAYDALATKVATTLYVIVG